MVSINTETNQAWLILPFGNRPGGDEENALSRFGVGDIECWAKSPARRQGVARHHSRCSVICTLQCSNAHSEYYPLIRSIVMSGATGALECQSQKY